MNGFDKLFPITAKILDITDNCYAGGILETISKIREAGVDYKDIGQDMVGKYITYDHWNPFTDKLTKVCARIKKVDDSDEWHKYEKVVADVFEKYPDRKDWEFIPNGTITIKHLRGISIRPYSKKWFDKKFIEAIGEDYLRTLNYGK